MHSPNDPSTEQSVRSLQCSELPKYTPKFTPLSADDAIQSGWIGRVRSIIVRDGHAVRASACHEVEAQNINSPDNWQPIMLTNGGTQFDGPIECAKVIDMLEGKTPIPEPKPQP